MGTEKTLTQHISDFWEGLKSTPQSLYDFGDYLARISGFRDWQLQHESVLPIDYVEQTKAITETKAIYNVLSNSEGRRLIVDALINDAENRVIGVRS